TTTHRSSSLHLYICTRRHTIRSVACSLCFITKYTHSIALPNIAKYTNSVSFLNI
ncbi:unnamed protein product, partial [Candidula unifasciata]